MHAKTGSSRRVQVVLGAHKCPASTEVGRLGDIFGLFRVDFQLIQLRVVVLIALAST